MGLGVLVIRFIKKISRRSFGISWLALKPDLVWNECRRGRQRMSLSLYI